MIFTVNRFESVTSTNDAAARMARDGAPEGTVVVAGEQTSGRGRYGRTWTSPPGDGLYLSLVLRPLIPLDHLWQLGFVTSLATAEAVVSVSGLPARIKWPNDVLLGGRKVAGILLEVPVQRSTFNVQRSPAGHVRPVIVGIGVNVSIERFPPEIAENATSIALEAGRQVPLEDIESALLSRLDGRYGDYIRAGFEPVMRAWKELDCTVGRRVTVRTGQGIVEGMAVGIEPTAGDVVVECKGGGMLRVSAGDVLLQDEATSI